MLAKKILFALGAGVVLLNPPVAHSAPTTPKECTQEMLMSYFPEKFVAETLKKFDVPEAQRAGIIAELAEKDKQLIPMVEERAGKMNPNPLRDPSLRQEAVKIFRDTLLELFSQVLQAHGVNSKDQIKAMLDDIQQQKAKAFASCLDQIQAEPKLREDAKKLNIVKPQGTSAPDSPSTEK